MRNNYTDKFDLLPMLLHCAKSYNMLMSHNREFTNNEYTSLHFYYTMLNLWVFNVNWVICNLNTDTMFSFL